MKVTPNTNSQTDNNEKNQSSESEKETESEKDDWENDDPGSLIGDSDSSDLSDDLKISDNETDNEAKQEKDVKNQERDDEKAKLDSKCSADGDSKEDPTVRKPTAPIPVYHPPSKRSITKKKVSLRDSLRAKWKLGPVKIPNIGHPNNAPPQIKRPRMAHTEMPSTHKRSRQQQQLRIRTGAWKDPNKQLSK